MTTKRCGNVVSQAALTQTILSWQSAPLAA
jgi:hypothetical protein